MRGEAMPSYFELLTELGVTLFGVYMLCNAIVGFTIVAVIHWLATGTRSSN